MRRLKTLQALVLPLILLLSTPFAQADTMRGIQVAPNKGQVLDLYTDYYALVIGVGRYTNGWPDLPGAQKDSAEVAAALEDYGFRVKLVTNPTSREIKKALSEMAFVTGKDAHRALLLYFAGHGETLNLADGTKLGYIIPADCPLKDKDPLGFDDVAISMKEIEALALKVQCKHVLMVFDSCFSGSLFSLVRSAPVEISEKSSRPVRQFITAGSEGEQVPDKSVFLQVFLDGIRSDADLNDDGYVTASELGMYLQTKVVNYTMGGQHPQYGKINNPRLDKGDFVFVPKSTRQKVEMEGAKAGTDMTQITQELKKLQEERKKNEELLHELKQLLEARARTEELQKKGVEEKLKLNEQERETSKAATDEKIRRMEDESKAVQERLAREAAARKAMEEELQKLRIEGRKKADTIGDLETKPAGELKTANLPSEVSAPRLVPATDGPDLKIAIFPVFVSGFEIARTRLIKGINLAVDTSDMFKEIFSFYEVEDRPDIKLIDKDIQKKEIWKRKSFFSSPEPNMDVVCEEAKKLGVDAVLAVFADADRSYFKQIAFVINPHKKKAYSGESGLVPGGKDTSKFLNMVGKVLDEYRKDR